MTRKSRLTPTTPIQQTIALLEMEIEAIEQRRGELLRVIESLRPLADGEVTTGRRKALKRNERTNERTNERANGGPTRARRSLPDEAGEAIIGQLRTHGPMTPRALARALKIARPVLTYRLKPLIKQGAVVANGATMNRQFSLPARSRAAKEAP